MDPCVIRMTVRGNSTHNLVVAPKIMNTQIQNTASSPSMLSTTTDNDNDRSTMELEQQQLRKMLWNVGLASCPSPLPSSPPALVTPDPAERGEDFVPTRTRSFASPLRSQLDALILRYRSRDVSTQTGTSSDSTPQLLAPPRRSLRILSIWKPYNWEVLLREHFAEINYSYPGSRLSTSISTDNCIGIAEVNIEAIILLPGGCEETYHVHRERQLLKDARQEAARQMSAILFKENAYSDAACLRTCGDVESNPGPSRYPTVEIPIRRLDINRTHKWIQVLSSHLQQLTANAEAQQETRIVRERGMWIVEIDVIVNRDFYYVSCTHRTRKTAYNHAARLMCTHLFTAESWGPQANLLLCGDVESNPGPCVVSRPMSQCHLLGRPLTPDENQYGVQTIFDAITAFIRSTIESGYEGISTLLEWARAKSIEAIMKPLVSHLKDTAFACSAELWETSIAAVYEILKMVTSYLACLWLIRKVHLYIHGAYSIRDLGSDFLFMFKTDLCAPAIDQAKKMISWCQGTHNQASFSDLCPQVAGLVTTVLFSTIGLNAAPHRNSVMHMFASRMAGESGKDAVTIIKDVINYCISYFTKGEEEITGEQHAKAKLETMEDLVPALMATYYHGKSQGLFTGASLNAIDVVHPTSMDDPIALLLRCRAVAQELTEPLALVTDHPRYRYWNEWSKSVLETWNIYRKSKAATKGRIEPIGILFTGRPGQGKSLLTKDILPELVLSQMNLIAKREQAENFVYSMPTDPNQKFMDGYWGQPWALYDDLGAAKSGLDLVSMINLVSTTTQPINMASLDDKGQYFVSTFVCATTNLGTFQNTAAVKDTEALTRRFPHAYQLEATAPYRLPVRGGTTNSRARGLLDHAKYTSDFEDAMKNCLQTPEGKHAAEIAFLDSVFAFTGVDMNTGGLGGVVPFADVLDRIVTHYYVKTRALKKNASLRQSIPVPLHHMADQNQAGGDVQEDNEVGEDVQEDYDTLFPKVVTKELFSHVASPKEPASENAYHDTTQLPRLGVARCFSVLLSSLEENFQHRSVDELARQFNTIIDEQITQKEMDYVYSTDARTVLQIAEKHIDSWDFCTRRDLLRKLRSLQDLPDLDVLCVSVAIAVRFSSRWSFTSGSFGTSYKQCSSGDPTGIIYATQFQSLKGIGIVPVGFSEIYTKIGREWDFQHKVGLLENLRWRGWAALMHAKEHLALPFKIFLFTFCATFSLQILIMAVVRICQAILNYFFPTEEQTGYTKDVRTKASRLRPIVSMKPSDVEHQALLEQNERNLIKRNLLFVRYGEGLRCNGWAQAWDSRHLLMPLHYVKEMQRAGGQMTVDMPTWIEDSKPLLYEGKLGAWTQIKTTRDCKVSDLDLVLVRMDVQIPNVRSIKRIVMDRKDFDDYFNGVKQSTRLLESLTTGRPDQVAVLTGRFESTADTTAGCVCIGFKVLNRTLPGTCGTPYVFRDKIVGIHVNWSGENACAGAVALVREEIREAEARLSVHTTAEHVTFELPMEANNPMPQWRVTDQGYECLGACEGVDGVRINSCIPLKTDKTKSLTRDTDMWPDKHLPAGQTRAILREQAQKYAFDRTPIAPSYPESRYAIEYHVSVMPENRNTDILSENEVLNGDMSVGLMPVKRDTSAGFWSAISQQKKDLIDSIPQPDGKPNHFQFSQVAEKKRHPSYGVAFLPYLREKERKFRAGERDTANFWVSSLKDELRPEKKVAEGKTRVFECPPFDSTFLCKKYFGRFANWYRTHAGPVLGHAIGLDKETNWKAILRHLTANGRRTHGIDMDYRKFDSTVPPAYFMYLRDLVEIYYHDSTTEERNARACILHEMQFTLHIIDGYICISQKGNKSGTWLTDLFNSVANTWAFLVAFHRTCTEQCGQKPTIADFAEYVTIFTLGDDVILTVDDLIKPWYNPKTIGEVLRSLGFDATAADKTELTTEFRPIESLSFLKSSFVDIGSVTMSPLPKEISYREMNWIKKGCRNNVSVKRCMISDALKFMSWHGKEDYDEFATQVRNHIGVDPDMLQAPPLIPTWSAYYDDVWEKQTALDFSDAFVHRTWDSLQGPSHSFESNVNSTPFALG